MRAFARPWAGYSIHNCFFSSKLTIFYSSYYCIVRVYYHHTRAYYHHTRAYYHHTRAYYHHTRAYYRWPVILSYILRVYYRPYHVTKPHIAGATGAKLKKFVYIHDFRLQCNNPISMLSGRKICLLTLGEVKNSLLSCQVENLLETIPSIMSGEDKISLSDCQV